jgi:hypothetical protein
MPLCGATANEERVSETFTYDSGPQAPFYGEGTGWDQKSNRWSIGSSEPPPYPKMSDPIGDGSLEYQDADGKKFPSQGNQLLNGSEGGIIARRKVDVNLPIFDNLRIDALDGKEPDDERGQDGLGKAKGTLWFSMLIQPRDADMSVILSQDVYNMQPCGVVFDYSAKNQNLSCGQLWWFIKPNQVSAKIPLSNPDKPTWVVAKIVFGDDWGADDSSNKLNAFRKKDDLSEPTGKLLVWINPKLGEEPKEDEVEVDVPLHEFRINRFKTIISKGAALDEIRMGTSFQQVNH